VGSAAPHRFASLTFAGITNHLTLSAFEDHTGTKKAPSPLRFAGAVQNGDLMTRQPKLH